MHGNNPIRPPVKGDGNQLEVKRIFATLQGEGPRAGEPAVFIRLGGCNLACAFCDTEFEDFTTMQVTEIVAEVSALAKPLVVITGGEPLRQPISRLCTALVEREFNVQIETNGTLWREDLPPEVQIVCSPKVTNGGYHPIRPDLLARVSAFKFIISEGMKEYSTVPEVGQSTHNTPVFVQPMDEYDTAQNARNHKLAAEIAKQHGYKLSTQLHKMLGIE